MDRKRVGILIFPNVEVLDFCGQFEVFSVTRLNEDARREEPSPFEVLLVAETPDAVVATGGLKVIPTSRSTRARRSTSSSCPAGGARGPRSRISACWTGSPSAGRRSRRDSFPAVTVEEKLHVVEDGNVLTSAGISAGIDMALRVVIRYFGEAVGRATARNMEYPFPADNSRRV